MKNGGANRNEIFVLTIPELNQIAYCQTCGKDGRLDEMVRLFESAIVCRSCDAEIRQRSQFERKAAMTPYPATKHEPQPNLRELWAISEKNRREFERHFDGQEKWLRRAEWCLAVGLCVMFLYGLSLAIYQAIQKPGNPFQQTWDHHFAYKTPAPSKNPVHGFKDVSGDPLRIPFDAPARKHDGPVQ